MITRRSISAGLLLCPFPVFASGMNGEIRAVINGIPTLWQVNTTPAARKTSWHGDAALANIRIAATPDDDPNSPAAGPLTLAFYVTDIHNQQIVSEVDIVYTDPLRTGAYVTVGHGSGSIISIETLHQTGPKLALRANFDVTLVFTDDFGVTLDKLDTKTITGHIDIILEAKQ